MGTSEGHNVLSYKSIHIACSNTPLPGVTCPSHKHPQIPALLRLFTSFSSNDDDGNPSWRH
eukprot:3514642-Rhodomonas_salina.1